MYKIVIVRHGLSVWPDKFTGWTDIDLAPEGLDETFKYGKKLAELGYTFDMGFSSVLKRGIKTLWRLLDGMDLNWIPLTYAWQLNERHYGALQGLNKAETAEKYGEEQVHIWRRSFDIKPPALEIDDSRSPRKDPIYSAIPAMEIPLAECLKDTVDRFLPYWKTEIAPIIIQNKKILIVAHGNSLRALVKYLDSISDIEISDLNIPTGIPLVYELDKDLIPMKHYYLGNSEEILRATAAVEKQGKLQK